MVSSKLVQLIAVSSVATILSLTAAPVAAMSLDSHSGLVSRHAHIRSELTVKKKRATSRRCKNRSAVFPPKTKAASSKAAQPTKASSGNNNNSGGGNSNSGGGGGGGGGSQPVYGAKVCLAWNNGEDSKLSQYATGKVKSIYTWSPYIPPNAKALGLEPMPMLWGAKQVGQFESMVKKGYAKTILGMNEPNQEGQALMSPQDGAELWKNHIEPKRALGYRTISPATTNAPSGKKWLQDMLKACKGQCTFDAVAVHFYDTSAQALIDYVTDHHNTFGKNILVTEYACQNFGGGRQCTKDETFAFHAKVTKFFEETPWIEAHCPFGFLHDMVNVNPTNQLMKSNGEPTDLGWMYLS